MSPFAVFVPLQGPSTESEDFAARSWFREWRSIQMQNPKKAAVITSTAIVAGSIVSSKADSSGCMLTSIATCRFESTFSQDEARRD